MGKGRWREEPPPITLAEMREVGLDLDFGCVLCPYSAEVPMARFEALPGETTLHELAQRARCTKGNHQGGVGVHPSDWEVWFDHLERTGQTGRIPYWGSSRRVRRRQDLR